MNLLTSKRSFWTSAFLLAAIALVLALPARRAESNAAGNAAALAPTPPRPAPDAILAPQIPAKSVSGRESPKRPLKGLPGTSRLLAENGRITDIAAEATGMNKQTRATVQARFDQLFLEQSKAFIARAVLDEEQSDPEEGITVFNVAAAPDRGVRMREDLESDLTPLLGRGEAQFLVAHLPVSMFGDYGRHPVTLRVGPSAIAGNLPGYPPEIEVRMNFANPAERISVTSSLELEEFRMRFGHHLEHRLRELAE